MMNGIEKFDKQKHVGTVFDEDLGRRVPVSDEKQLPKHKSNAELIMYMSAIKQKEENDKQKRIEELLRIQKKEMEKINRKSDPYERRRSNSRSRRETKRSNGKHRSRSRSDSKDRHKGSAYKEGSRRSKAYDKDRKY